MALFVHSMGFSHFHFLSGGWHFNTHSFVGDLKERGFDYVIHVSIFALPAPRGVYAFICRLRIPGNTIQTTFCRTIFIAIMDSLSGKLQPYRPLI
jgi:hypothetical protein